jgi:hypothetical protein
VVSLPLSNLNVTSESWDVLTIFFPTSPWTPDIHTPRVNHPNLHHPNVQNQDIWLTMITDDWELYVAATSNPSLRDRFVSTIATWLGSTPTNFAFTDLYDTVTGE